MRTIQEEKQNAGFNPSRLAAFFAPKESSRQTWIEVFIITLGALGICTFFEPNNPLLIGVAFPWLWLAPTVLALRYGSLAALGSATILLVVWFFLKLEGLIPNTFPGQYFLGGLTLTLIAGEFCDVWTGRFNRIRSVNAYLSQRLDSLTHRHYLLKVSSELLEQDLLTKPMTLRESLTQLRQLIVIPNASHDNSSDQATIPTDLKNASELMQILTQACQLESASLHAEINGQIQLIASSRVGSDFELVLDDPMVVYALTHNQLCHVQTDAILESHSRYLVVSPLIAANGCRLGLFVVEHMPFISLNQELLQFIQVTLNYYADAVNTSSNVQGMLRHFQDCPYLFASEFMHLDRIYRESGISSTLVALVFEKNDRQQDLFAETMRVRRQLDVVWAIQRPDHFVLLTLMPLYNQRVVTGYLMRLEQHFLHQFNAKSLDDAGVVAHSVTIGTRDPHGLLRTILSQCHVD